MRYYFLVLFAALIFSVMSTVPARSVETPAARPSPIVTTQQQTSSVDEIVKFLLTSAATDFHEHGPAGPLRFRKARVGHTSGAEPRYQLCGQFLQTQKGDKAEWMSFVTIKTSGYEQYIGGQAAGFCKDVKWDTEGDLSASLQSQLDALK